MKLNLKPVWQFLLKFLKQEGKEIVNDAEKRMADKAKEKIGKVINKI